MFCTYDYLFHDSLFSLNYSVFFFVRRIDRSVPVLLKEQVKCILPASKAHILYTLILDRIKARK